MKKHFLKFLLVMFVLVSAATTGNAQTRIYVKARPTVVVTSRNTAPRRGYVWVDDEWTVRNGAYVQVAGHWVAQRRGYVWVKGHWATERRGDYWIADIGEEFNIIYKSEPPLGGFFCFNYVDIILKIRYVYIQ